MRATVANEDLARLRLSFFRSSLEGLLAPKPNSSEQVVSPTISVPSLPVLDCLAETMTDFPHLDFTPLFDLLNAREAFLAYPNFTTLPSLESFAAAPHKPLLTLHTNLLSTATPIHHAQITDAISQASIAVGLSILLRAVPVHAASRLSYMPRQHQRTADFLHPTETSLPVFQTVARAADSHADSALTIVQHLSRDLRPAFWPLHLARLYLRRLATAGHNPFDGRLVTGLQTTWYIAVQMRLLRARYLGS